MNLFFLLNSRKRAVIALIHAAVFLAIAVMGLRGGARPPMSLHTIGGAMLYTIYGIVTALLIWLFSKAHFWRERMYFGFCAASAALSIVRGIVGDPALHPIQLLKVFMLLSGAAAGIGIYRCHSAVRRPFIVSREPQLSEAD